LTALVPIPDNLDELAAAIDGAHKLAVGRANDAIDMATQILELGAKAFGVAGARNHLNLLFDAPHLER
jgi:hypothetical protein